MGIALAILVLGIVVAIHEFGHFAVAKLCGIGVLEFSVGFGKILWSKKYGDTVYALRLIPLGGFVRMVGDDPRVLDGEQVPQEDQPPTPEYWGVPELDAREKELLKNEDLWFVKKSVAARSAVVIAGPLANLISALFIAFVSVWYWGVPVPENKPILGRTVPTYPAEKVGIKSGDLIVSVNGSQVSEWIEFAKIVHDSGGKELSIDVLRKLDGVDSPLNFKVTGIQDSEELKFIDSKTFGSGFKIGVSPAQKTEAVSVIESAEISAMHIWRLAVMSVKGVAGLILGAISVESIGGPIFIVKETMQSAQEGFADLLRFVVFLSVSLAVLNLLPVPVLDGGHLLFFLIEAIKGSRVSLRTTAMATQVGMVLLMALTVLALSNDIVRLVKGM